MSTLTEIEAAVKTLPRRQQEVLLRHLSAKLHPAARRVRNGGQKCWPVPPPKVSKAESRRIERRIGEQFGRIEMESWK